MGRQLCMACKRLRQANRRGSTPQECEWLIGSQPQGKCSKCVTSNSPQLRKPHLYSATRSAGSRTVHSAAFTCTASIPNCQLG